MVRTMLLTAAAVVIGLSFVHRVDAGVASDAVAGQRETTQRKVSGIITAVDATSVTIAPVHGRAMITGKVDARRTRVALDGKPGGVGDLQVTFNAKGELGLDDVWMSISATR